MEKIIPVYILSGFLGSGKTTLLKKMADHYLGLDKQPAVVMNEIGDVNFDKILIDDVIPMEELLSGCICCTASGDLGVTVKELIENNDLDVIFIEATGAANPVEIFDAVTEASLFQKIDLKSMITVVDSPYLLELSERENNKTVQLMQDQIRYASVLILNKMDLVQEQDKNKLHSLVRDLNPNVAVIGSVHCDVDMNQLDAEVQFDRNSVEVGQRDHHEHHDHDRQHMHHSHDHVAVYTHYFDKPIERGKFEQFMSELPKTILRAKGILQFNDSAEQHLLQYAYYRVNLIAIGPQSEFPNVLVLIGESLPKEELKNKLEQL